MRKLPDGIRSTADSPRNSHPYQDRHDDRNMSYDIMDDHLWHLLDKTLNWMHHIIAEVVPLLLYPAPFLTRRW